MTPDKNTLLGGKRRSEARKTRDYKVFLYHVTVSRKGPIRSLKYCLKRNISFSFKPFEIQIACIPRQQQVKVAYKPQFNINSLFPSRKAQHDSDRPKLGTLYRTRNCKSYDFV